MRRTTYGILTFLSAFGLLSGSTAQENADSASPEAPAASGIPVPIDISRRNLKNFLVDAVALQSHLSEDGSKREFVSAFAAGSVEAKHAFFWDPETCRLLGVVQFSQDGADGSSQAPAYPMLAAGVHPLENSEGAFGDPEYFGLRTVDGAPEFLFTYGSLIVEERIWLEDMGNTLKQRFTIREPAHALSLALPAEWKGRATASVGEWKENSLVVAQEEAAEVIITYRLVEEISEPPIQN